MTFQICAIFLNNYFIKAIEHFFPGELKRLTPAPRTTLRTTPRTTLRTTLNNQPNSVDGVEKYKKLACSSYAIILFQNFSAQSISFSSHHIYFRAKWWLLFIYQVTDINTNQWLDQTRLICRRSVPKRYD